MASRIILSISLKCLNTLLHSNLDSKLSKHDLYNNYIHSFTC